MTETVSVLSRGRASSFLLVFFFPKLFRSDEVTEVTSVRSDIAVGRGSECARETVFLGAAADTHGNFIMKIRAYAPGSRARRRAGKYISPGSGTWWWPGKRTAAVAIRNAADIRWEEGGRGEEISQTTRRAKFHNVALAPKIHRVRHFPPERMSP